MSDTLRIPHDEMRRTLENILLAHHFPKEKAATCAELVTDNTADGVLSHGLGRFPRLVAQADAGEIDVHADPEKIGGRGAVEIWDGKSGIGPVNALHCTERSIHLAEQSGIGCVALRNTTHWMRAGAYGWKAASRGFALLCWTNTTPNMLPWGSDDPAIGNNPLVIAIPRSAGPVVLDMAMSQFSYGKMETLAAAGEKLPFPGGYGPDGSLTDDPVAILDTGRVLSAGYWKGAGLSIVLDLLAATLSGGSLTKDISRSDTHVSQVYIAIDLTEKQADEMGDALIADLAPAVYPGARVKANREDSERNGIAVPSNLWEQVKQL